MQLQPPVAQTMLRSTTSPSSSYSPMKPVVQMMLPSDILASSIRPAVEGQGIQLIRCGTNCLLGLDKQGKIVPILLKEDEILVGKSDQDLPSAAQLDEVLDTFLQKWQQQHPAPLPSIQVPLDESATEEKEQKEPDTPGPIPTAHHTLDSPHSHLRHSDSGHLSIPLPAKQGKESMPSTSSALSTTTSSILRDGGLSLMTSTVLAPKVKHRLPRTMHVYPHPSAPRLVSVGFPSAPKEYGALMMAADDALENPFLVMKPAHNRFGKVVSHPDQAGISGSFVCRYGWHPEFECVARPGQRLKKSSSSSSTGTKSYQPTVTKFPKASKHQQQPSSPGALFQPRDSYRLWIGLCDQDIHLVDQPSCHRFVGFRYSSALDSSKGTWQCVTSDGTHQTMRDSAGLMITDSKVKFEEKKSIVLAAQVSLAGTTFYINGEQVAFHDKYLPDAATPLAIVSMLMNTGQEGLDELALSKFSLNF